VVVANDGDDYSAGKADVETKRRKNDKKI